MGNEPQRIGLDPADYDDRWARLAASGHDVHGEAACVDRLLGRPARVLDAGCGTGRVAIRLAELGHAVCGVDVDPALVDRARAKAPALAWHEADLARLAPGEVAGPYDAIVLAGNVMIFLAPGSEAVVVRNLARRLAPGGLLVAGFQLRAGGLTVDDYEACTAGAGLAPVARFATWDGDPFVAGGDYVVAVDRTPRLDEEPDRPLR